MSDLDARLDLAKSLFGGSSSQSTNTIKGTVMADSSSGTVSVKIGEVEYDDDGNIIVPESELIATIPIIGSASTGDEVTVIVEDGSPTAIAAPGWGDSIEEKTQYITFVSSPPDAGLHIHENPNSYNSDGDLHLTSGGLEIRDSGTVLADFDATTIHLGKNSTTSQIDLCNGTGKITGASAGLFDYVSMSGEGIQLKAQDMLSLEATATPSAMGTHMVTIKAGSSSDTAKIELEAPVIGHSGESTITLKADKAIFALADNFEINGDPGFSGYVLTSQGAGSPPIWSTPSGGSATTWYGTSSTAAGTQTKDVTCADFVLEKGAIITVYFTNANTYGALKLNVNSTGAIAVYHRGTATSSSNVVSWNKKDYVTFQYDGTYWVFISSSGSRVISSKDRLTSANVGTNGTGGLNHLICKATTMTTGTPASDGHIIDLDWDANYSQHAQLFLPCVDNQFPQWRMQVNNAWTAWDTFYTVANPPSGCSLAWNQVAQTTNNTAATIDLTGYSEVLIVADALRNSAHHFFSVNVPIQAIGSTAAEYKLGGYVGANASTSGGAWCSMNLTSFNGVQLFINNTSFLSSTTWTVYAR